MNFIFENAGINTFLVYQVQEDDVLDTMSLGMLTNNKISGLASTIYTQMDTEKFIKYNVSAKISVKQFFSGPVNRARLLGVFNGIVNAMLSAEDYMIKSDSILMDTDFIFSDVSTCETILICLPMQTEGRAVDLGAFFKDIMFNTQFDQTENCDYVAKIMNHLNSTPVFSLVDFKNMLDGLNRPSQVNAAPQMNNAITQDRHIASATQPTVQPFQQMPVQHVPQPVVSQPTVPPIKQQAVQPIVEQNPIQTICQPPTIPDDTILDKNNSTAVDSSLDSSSANEAHMTRSYLLQHYTKENRAIFDAQKKAGKRDASSNSRVSGTHATGEKPMSKLYLFQHYTKENKAIYDAQQAAKKNAGAASQTAKPATQQKNSFAVPGTPTQNAGFAIPGQNALDVNPVANQCVNNEQPVTPIKVQTPVTPVQQPAVQPIQQLQSPVRPVYTPPQSVVTGNGGSFGETVVLNGGMAGDTTVLNAGMLNQQTINPHLVRSKNNEKVPINKPVFRIGKEKSYVDYFIADNSAISRSHANIITRDGKYYVMDTNSTNHTYLDGSILQSNSEYEIVHGSKIRFANEDFEFKLY